MKGRENMKIIDFDKSLDKKRIADSAYEICGNAKFPVEYQDVYEHLFGREDLILKLLMNDEHHLVGFGVFENYSLVLYDQITTMLYLSGMVIDPKYQGKNISGEILKCAYKQLKSDFISLRTQNIAMAKSLMNAFCDNLFVMPGNVNELVLRYLRQAPPFKDINEYGVIKDCYSNQLYYNLGAIKDSFGIELQSCDALGVVVEPKDYKRRVLSRFDLK